MLSSVSFALVAALAQCPLPSQNRTFDQVRATFPYSVANAMAISADGRYIYAGEGGSIAILDTSLSNGDGYGIDAPRIPISKFAARPARILADAGTDPAMTDDKLIICAGRSGLWIMDAHPSGPTYRAAVVDDSGNGSVSIQLNRRFCNDAEVFSIDGTDYLAVTFAKKNQSRLRIYDLDAVRAVLDNTPAGEWTGGEIAALHDVKIRKRSGVLTQTDPGANTHNYSLTIGLSVDQINTTEATLYLALWHQGLARVRVDLAGGGGLDLSGVEFGPVFGNGSAYHLNPLIPASQREWYSNFRIIDDGFVAREEPPVFTDVAVQTLCGHYLYATVDTLGWVRFDLDGTWSPSMPIDHHEGAPFPVAPAQHPFGEIQFALDGDYSYSRQVRVIQRSVQSGDEVVLAVNTSPVTMVQPVGYRTEGSVFSHGGGDFNGIPARFFLEDAIIRGSGAVLLYDVDCQGVVGAPTVIDTDDPNPGLPPPYQETLEIPPFRNAVPVGKDMALFADSTLDPLDVFIHRRNDTARYRRIATGPFTRLGGRVLADRAGYESFVIGYSVVNPDVLMAGTNDGGFPSHGIMTTCGSEIVNFFSPNSQGFDGRLNNGNFFDQEGQWPVLSTEPEYAGMQFAIGTSDFRYRLRLYDPGDPCAVPVVEPELVHTWLIKTRTHRFGARDRWYFQGTVNDDYDADTGVKMLFVSGSQSPQGIVAFDRVELENWVFDNMEMDAENPTKDVLNIINAEPGVVLATLNTDPELRAVPNGEAEPAPTFQFLQKQQFPGDPAFISIAGGLQSYTPRTFKVPSAQGVAPDTWVLAAPCGFLENGEDDVDALGQHYVSYTDNDWEAVAPYDDLTRLLIQFWDVSDPAGFDDQNNLGLPEKASMIGEYDFANAINLKVKEHLGRTYIFVADFGGRIQVFDVTDVMWHPTDPVKLIETWIPAKSLTDNLTNNVWELEVDRAQWSSGGEDFDEIYVYAAVERLGIEVLHFDPSCVLGQRLKKVQLIQTPGNVRAMVIRDTGTDKSLLLSDGEAGIRVLEYNF